MQEVYIHHSQYEELRNFDPNKFDPIKNIPYFEKPWGGLWASSTESKFGWKEYCECEMGEERLGIYSFCFTISENANVFHIRDISDIMKIPLISFSSLNDPFNGIHYVIIPDFEECVDIGIDAIRFHLDENPTLRHVLRSWDCDCILILNKDIVIPKEKA